MMIHQRRPPQIGYLKRRFPKWETSNKTVYYFLGSITLVFVLICGPFIFFANENFRFFQNLALDTSPSLLAHLEREQVWFNILSLALLISVCLANWWFALKFVRNFRGQIISFDRHLKHLIRGEWFIPPLRVREKDDFKDLVEQYSYFYKSIQAMTKSEIQLLEKMKIDPSQRENYVLWKTLLQQKKSRMGYEEIVTENTHAATSSIYWKRAS
jgi:hypothetical protein